MLRLVRLNIMCSFRVLLVSMDIIKRGVTHVEVAVDGDGVDHLDGEEGGEDHMWSDVVLVVEIVYASYRLQNGCCFDFSEVWTGRVRNRHESELIGDLV